MSTMEARGGRAIGLVENPLIKPLRTSLTVHFTRPLIPATMLASSGAIFLARGWLGNGFDGRGLGSIVAMPPMDAFGDFGFTGAGLKSLALAPLRLAALWFAMTQLIAATRGRESLPPKVRSVPRFGIMYLLALASVAATFLLFGVLLEAVGPALQGFAGQEGFGSSTPMLAGFLFYLAGLPLFLVLAVLFTPSIGRTLAGLPMKPSINQGAVWLAAFLSVSLWWGAIGPSPASGNTGFDFAGAFLAALLQSVLYGAAVIAASTDQPRRNDKAPLPDNFSIFKRKKPTSILERLSS